MERKQLEKILNVLSSSKFSKWYSEDGNFDRWIRGDEKAPSREKILKDIENIFCLD